MPPRYRVLAALLAALLTSGALAQPPADLDAYRGGGPGSDVGQAVAVGPDGAVVVAGEFEQTATFGTLSVTSADAPGARSDVFVVKYAADGTPLWARRMGTGVFNDFAGGVAIGPTHDVVVSGFFTGIATWDGGASPDVTLTTRNDFDAFVAAYDASGDLLWVQQGGGRAQDTGRGVSTDAFGNVYATGSFTGEATWGDGRGDTTLVTPDSTTSDAFLVKYAPDGRLLWARRAGGTESDDGRDVAVLVDTFGDDGVYTVGTFRGVALFGALPLQSRGLSDVYVTRYSAGGAIQWVQQIGANGNEYGRGIAAYDMFGPEVYVTGSFEETILVGTDVLTSAGFSDVLVAALDGGTGGLHAGARGGGEGFDIGNDVAPAIGNDVDVPVPAPLVTGYTDGDATFEPAQTSSGMIEVEGRGFTDGFAASYFYPAGFTGVELFGGSNADRGYGAGASPQDGIIPQQVALTGSFRDTGTFGDATLLGVGGNDVYVVTADACALGYCVVASEEAPGHHVALSPPVPNPAAGRTTLALTLDRARTLTVEVLDALGRRVAVLHDGPLAAGPHALALDAGALAPGVYAVRATGEGVRVVRRLAVGR